MSSPSAAGTDSGTGRGTLDNLLRPTMSDRTISVASVKSGVVGLSPTATIADHYQPSGPSPLPYRTAEGTPQHGNFDFEHGQQPAQLNEPGTGVGDRGVGTGASTIAAEKAFKNHQDQEPAGVTGSATAGTGPTGSGVTSSATGEREFPLSGGTATTASPTDPTEPGVASTLGSGAPRTEQAVGDGRAGLADAASGALEHEHGGHGHTFDGDPCPPGEGTTEQTSHFTSGPHVTDTANRLDPNLQSSGTSQAGHGSQSGLDTQPSSTLQTDVDPQAGYAPQSTQKTDPSVPESQDTSDQHHYGRDAALAGAGATAAGAGAYALGSGDKRDTGPAPNTIGPHKSDVTNIVDPRVQPEPEKMKNTGTKDTNTGPASATLGPHQSNLANVADPRVQPEPEKMKDRETTGPHRSDLLNRLDPRVDSSRKNVESGAVVAGADTATGATTEGLSGGDPNISSPYNVQPIDPRVDAHSGSQTEEKEHHYGRDAAVAGGVTAAGAAGYGAYEANKKQDEPISSSQPSFTGYGTQPGSTAQPSTTSQPSTSATVAQPSTTTQQTGVSQPSSSTTKPLTTTNETNPEMPGAFPESTEREKTHYGRDAAVAGGAAATGAGAYEAYEASKPSASEPAPSPQPPSTGYDTQTGPTSQEPSILSSSQPSGTGQASQVDPTHQQSSAVPPSQPSNIDPGSQPSSIAQNTGAVTTGPARVTESSGPTEYGSQGAGYDSQQEPQHHYGRDAAVAGGVGAAGVGAYEAGKHTDDSGRIPPGTTTGYDSQRAEMPAGHPAQRAAVETTGTSGRADTATDAPTQAQREEPKEHHYGRDAAVVGGAGAVGAGAAYEYQQHEAEKQAKEAQAQAEKEAKQHQKELEKSQAQADKDLKAQQKANEKEQKKEQKEHDKAVAAAEKEHQKEVKKQEKEQEKAAAAEEKERKKQDEKELAVGAGGAAAAGGAVYAAEEGKDQDEEKHKKPGLLDKILHPRRSKEQSGEEAEAAETEQAIRDKSNDQESHPHGVVTDESGRHRLHKDPPASHPAAQANQGIVTEKHTGLPMNVGKYGSGQGGTDGADRQIPGYQGEEAGATAPQDRVVIEPHTGLPMNVGKYGSGEGGTDGAEQIRNTADEGFEPRKTDWEEIKKANTPY